MKIDEAIADFKNWNDMGFSKAETPSSEHIVMAIKALESQRWISVSERLPDTSGYKLVVNKGYLPYIASYHLNDNEFVCDDGVCFPTHWKAMPEPPEVE